MQLGNMSGPDVAEKPGGKERRDCVQHFLPFSIDPFSPRRRRRTRPLSKHGGITPFDFFLRQKRKLSSFFSGDPAAAKRRFAEEGGGEKKDPGTQKCETKRAPRWVE